MRYVNQHSAAPVIPMPVRRSRSSVWEIVLNAALRSRRIRMVSSPESGAMFWTERFMEVFCVEVGL